MVEYMPYKYKVVGSILTLPIFIKTYHLNWKR